MAPLAVRVAVLPGQMVADGTASVGVAVTDTVPEFVPEQFRALVPVTVYACVEEGLTVTVPPLMFPGFQV